VPAFSSSAIALLATTLLWVMPGVSFGATAKVENRVLVYAAAGANENTLEVSGPACYSPFPDRARRISS
jgi:hypothetical protein